MKRPLLSWLIIGAVAASAAPVAATDHDADTFELSGSVIELVDAETAAALLGTEDGFVALHSPFDRQARMASSEPGDTEAYLAFVAAEALDWTDEERTLIADAIERIRAGLEAEGLALALPDQVALVRTTGAEEFGVCGYTRESYVVLTTACPLGGTGFGPPLEHLLAHELFHVMTRHDPMLRDELYAIIGFEPLGAPFEAPPEVADLRMTNPDAPLAEHAVELTVDGETARFVPVLYSPRAYDGGRFGEYLDPRLLPLGDEGEAARLADGSLDLRAYGDVPAFFDAVGTNTDYIIHPEEILAENAAALILGRRDAMPSPWVVDAMAELLRPDAAS